MPELAACPYCKVLSFESPTRKRKCAHCGKPMTEAQAKKYDYDRGRPFAWMTRDETITYWRAHNAKQAREAKRSGIKISGFRFRSNASHCSYCRSQNNVLLLPEWCQAENMPPFAGCTNEQPCLVLVEAIFDDPRMKRMMDDFD
jgi:hypothetical protein